MIVIILISLYTVRAVLNALGPSDYGIYNVVGGFVALIIFFNGTISNATQRFLTFELGHGDKEKLAKTFSTLFAIHFLFAIIILLVSETIGLWFVNTQLVFPQERKPAVNFLYQCSIVTLLVNFINIPYNASIISHERMDIFAYISMLEVFFKLAVVFLMIHSPFDKLCSYAFLLVLVSLIITTIYHIYCVNNFSECNYNKKHLSRNIFKEIFAYTSWTVIGNSSSVFKEQGINVLINIFFGTVINASRAISMQVYTAINSFAVNFMTAIRPQITKSYANGDIDRAINLTLKSAKFSSYLLILLSIPVFVESNFILKLWLKEVPAYSTAFVQWVLILSIARMLQNSPVVLYLATGKVKYVQIVGGGIMLLNLPISYIFLKLQYSPVVTVIIGLVIELVVFIIILLFIRKMMAFPFLKFIKEVLLKLILIIGLAVCLPLFISNSMTEGLYRLIVVTLSSIVSVIVTVYFIGFDASERKTVNYYISNFVAAYLKHENN
jgi:O-antigen/teichoic acid export membrane protein